MAKRDGGKLEDMTFDELVELATMRAHSALLTGGGKEMKGAMHMWLGQAILWSQGQERRRQGGRNDGNQREM